MGGGDDGFDGGDDDFDGGEDGFGGGEVLVGDAGRSFLRVARDFGLKGPKSKSPSSVYLRFYIDIETSERSKLTHFKVKVSNAPIFTTVFVLGKRSGIEWGRFQVDRIKTLSVVPTFKATFRDCRFFIIVPTYVRICNLLLKFTWLADVSSL